jgi:hypothetical protein
MDQNRTPSPSEANRTPPYIKTPSPSPSSENKKRKKIKFSEDTSVFGFDGDHTNISKDLLFSRMSIPTHAAPLKNKASKCPPNTQRNLVKCTLKHPCYKKTEGDDFECYKLYVDDPELPAPIEKEYYEGSVLKSKNCPPKTKFSKRMCGHKKSRKHICYNKKDKRCYAITDTMFINSLPSDVVKRPRKPSKDELKIEFTKPKLHKKYTYIEDKSYEEYANQNKVPSSWWDLVFGEKKK